MQTATQTDKPQGVSDKAGVPPKTKKAHRVSWESVAKRYLTREDENTCEAH